jgi:hypothetical protein
VRHKDHLSFRYLSPWTTKDPALMFEFAKQTKPIDTGYRSKLAHLGIGYREEVKGIGLGHEHPMWNQAVSVRRPEEIPRDSPSRSSDPLDLLYAILWSRASRL